MAETASSRPSGERNRVLAATLAVQTLNTWGLLAVASIAPLVAEGLGVAAVLIGYQISLIYVVAAATSLVAGGLVGRWGATATSQISLLACAAGAGLAAAGTLSTLLAATAAVGFGYGLTNPASSQLLFAHTTARDRSFVFSLKQTGVPLGGVLAGLVTPALALAIGWQHAIATVAVPALALAAAMQGPRGRWDAGHDAGEVRMGAQIIAGAGTVLRDGRLRALSMGAFCFAAIQLCLMGFVVTFAVTELGFGAVLAGVLLAAVQVSGAVGRLSWGWLADRMQANATVLAVTAGVTVAGCAGFWALSPGTPTAGVFAAAVLFGFSAIGWNGVFLAEVARLAPERMIGSVTGVTGTLSFAGVVAGPSAFVGLHAIVGDFGAAYLTLAGVALAGAAPLVMRLRRRAW